jgi:hypothetical protein
MYCDVDGGSHPHGLTPTGVARLVACGRSGDPNPYMREDAPVDAGRVYLTLKEAARRTGVDLRWLKDQARIGTISTIRDESFRSGPAKFRYLIDEALTDRIRLRYLRGRRANLNAPRGITRDGIDYQHDGTVRRRKPQPLSEK